MNDSPCSRYPATRGVPLLLAIGALLFVVIVQVVRAQEAEEEYQAIPWSQRGAVMQRVGYTDITITYSRPVARGRGLFGGVVEWERAWTPGADSATTISLSRDVEVDGRALPAGRYTIWMIPRADAPWTVIFSERTGILHAPYPGEEFDARRLEITPTAGDHMEVLAFYFPVVDRETAILRMHWGETVIPLAIRTPAEP
jgi:hypothetical protein